MEIDGKQILAVFQSESGETAEGQYNIPIDFDSHKLKLMLHQVNRFTIMSEVAPVLKTAFIAF